MSNDLLVLAEWCEKATGPDRELDRAIEYVCAPERVGKIECPMLEYTASIDAALTLVPEGWGVRIETPAMAHAPVTCPPSAAMLHYLPKRAVAAGATPALALCAAALRARGQQ